MKINIHEFLHSGAIVALSASEVVLGWGASWRDDCCVDGEVCWWVQPFFRERSAHEHGWLRFSHTARVTRGDLITALTSELTELAPRSNSWSPFDRAVYERMFHGAQDQFQRGELQKLILYSERRAAWNTRQRGAVLLAALEHQALSPFGYWQPRWGWIGATPEVLFEYSSPTSVLIDAMAGTVVPGERAKLLHEPKLLHEQQIVIDDILAEIGSLGTVEQAPVQVYENEVLAHRYTRVTLQGRAPLAWETLVEKLHPTAAVGGSPRDRAHEALRALDREIPRLYYGAPIGARLGPGEGRCLVGLRGVYFSEDTTEARIMVGGGVSAESTIEDEWSELALKFEAIRRCLNL